MKKMKMLLAVVLALVLGCKKKVQPDIGNAQNACDCIGEVNADFLMEEMTGLEGQPWTQYTNTDSIFAGKTVRFTAIEDNGEYEWIAGQETLYSRSFIRAFPETYAYQSLPIQLNIKKKPNSICFPLDDGIAERTKYITPIPYPQTPTNVILPLIGSFRLKSPLHADSITLITELINGPGLADNYVNLYNYDGNGSNSVSELNPLQNYREMFFENNGAGAHIRGNFRVKMGGEVEFNLVTGLQSQNNIKEYKYRGRKL